MTPKQKVKTVKPIRIGKSDGATWIFPKAKKKRDV